MTTQPDSGHDARESDGAPPVFRALDRGEIDEILARNNVGRLAFSLHDRVDIEPINYVFDSGWIYGRTSRGAKLSTIAHHRWVAFEVDEVRGIFQWSSVVVKGAFYLIDADTSIRQDPAFNRGVELLRALIPQTLTANDPTPFRNSVFRIHLDEITGRAANE
jgi:nitroimidazol reductase NimA-like FMN-containing flavoprotein (pyridoxamine 5'-phosphate oxidase superfamily)